MVRPVPKNQKRNKETLCWVGWPCPPAWFGSCPGVSEAHSGGLRGRGGPALLPGLVSRAAPCPASQTHKPSVFPAFRPRCSCLGAMAQGRRPRNREPQQASLLHRPDASVFVLRTVKTLLRPAAPVQPRSGRGLGVFPGRTTPALPAPIFTYYSLSLVHSSLFQLLWLLLPPFKNVFSWILNPAALYRGTTASIVRFSLSLTRSH